VSISSVTSWVDGDPLTPSTLNAKLTPIVESIVALTDSPGVRGSGTSGFVPRWASVSTLVSNITLVNGSIQDFGADGVAIGNTPESGQSFLVYGPSKLSGAVTMNGAVTMSGAVTAGGSVTVTGSVAMTGALTVSGSTTSLNGVQYVWPSSQGSAGNVLVNDGSGGLTWDNAGVFSDLEIFNTAPSPYTVTAADVGRRLVSSATAYYGALILDHSNTSSIATSSRIKMAGFNQPYFVNSDFSNTKVDSLFVANFGVGINSLFRYVSVIAEQSDGALLVGGSFASNSTFPRQHLARLNGTTGALDATYTPSPSSIVDVILMQSDGSAVVGGVFATISGQTQPGIARLNSFGSVDTSFVTIQQGAGVIERVYTGLIQSSGKVVYAGSFKTTNNVGIKFIARANVDGSLDTTFVDASFDSVIYSIAEQSDGKIVVGGDFNSVSSITYRSLARINADGSLDTSFAELNISPWVSKVFVQPDDKVLVSGPFTSVAGTTRNYLARLHADGSLDTTYDPNLNSFVRSFVTSTDSKVVIGGAFTTVGGVSRPYLGRLNNDGSLDTSYTPSLSRSVFVVAPNGGAYWVGSDATVMSGTTIELLASLGFPVPNTSYDTVSLPSGSLSTVSRYGTVTLEKIGPAHWAVIDTNL